MTWRRDYYNEALTEALPEHIVEQMTAEEMESAAAAILGSADVESEYHAPTPSPRDMFEDERREIVRRHTEDVRGKDAKIRDLEKSNERLADAVRNLRRELGRCTCGGGLR